jgi:hypothetical protein
VGDTTAGKIDGAEDVTVGRGNVQQTVRIEDARSGGDSLDRLARMERRMYDDMDERQSNSNYIMLRMEAKLDQALAEQVKQAQTLTQVVQQQTQFDRRLYAIEMATQRPVPNIDKIMVIALGVAVALMFAWTVIAPRLP